ncbi:hypothetical protein NA57DRAFT_46639 [Rhizodiscina lignyota]|uniref:Uncharacterized protein n=1 Tax=Rhizodiscina lignyota TaxID=1504668 RepID=A0A9P4I8B3_9PEZI|nr:hypothetical protein NA57DRAFT_46639 [Rhizodiscina lignyota]
MTEDPQPYLTYYTSQCQLALYDSGRHCSARQHQDITDVIIFIRQSFHFDAILQTLRNKYQNHVPQVPEPAMRRTIELAARIVTMHEIGKWQGTAPNQDRLVWDAGPLSNCLIGHYTAPALDGKVKLGEKLFNAVSLEKIAGFEIVWTNNIAEHLRLRDDGTLTVFPHATFLKAQIDYHHEHQFPPGFIRETLSTLALLFPQHNREVGRWISKQRRERQRQGEHLDDQLQACGVLSQDERQLKNFIHWRDRLQDLKQSFDDAEPQTPGQWWNDRRKRVQWWTFWVAAIALLSTVFFSAVQSVEGAIQVYKAYHPHS